MFDGFLAMAVSTRPAAREPIDPPGVAVTQRVV